MVRFRKFDVAHSWAQVFATARTDNRYYVKTEMLMNTGFRRFQKDFPNF